MNDESYSAKVKFSSPKTKFVYGQLLFSDGHLTLLHKDQEIFKLAAKDIDAVDIDPVYHSIWGLSVNGISYRLSFREISFYTTSKLLTYLTLSKVRGIGNYFPTLAQIQSRDHLIMVLRPYKPVNLPVLSASPLS
jgi:hypothetical protein